MPACDKAKNSRAWRAFSVHPEPTINNDSGVDQNPPPQACLTSHTYNVPESSLTRDPSLRVGKQVRAHPAAEHRGCPPGARGLGPGFGSQLCHSPAV